MSSTSTPVIRLAITVNGEPLELEAPCTVRGLLDHLEVGTGRVAVAINRSVVPRSRHAETALAAGDRVEILEAVGGG